MTIEENLQAAREAFIEAGKAYHDDVGVSTWKVLSSAFARLIAAEAATKAKEPEPIRDYTEALKCKQLRIVRPDGEESVRQKSPLGYWQLGTRVDIREACSPEAYADGWRVFDATERTV